MLAGDVIEEARDRHPAFDKTRHPQKVVRRALSTYVGVLLGKINEIDEQAITVEQEFNMPVSQALFALGFAVPANRGIEDIVAVDQQTRRLPVELIRAGNRSDRNSRIASAWLVNGVLYLNGVLTSWNGVTKIAVRYAPVAGLLATDADVLAVPDPARAACIEATALAMARRKLVKEGEPPIVVAEYAAIAKQAEDDYLTEVGNALTGQVFRVRDVWPGTR